MVIHLGCRQRGRKRGRDHKMFGGLVDACGRSSLLLMAASIGTMLRIKEAKKKKKKKKRKVSYLYHLIGLYLSIEV